MKLTVVTVTLALLLTSVAFASGEVQDEGIYPGKWDGWGPVKEMPESQVYTGTFRMEEGAYPAIFTDAGKLYYLMIPIMPRGSLMPPADGAALRIEAFKSPFSPVHLMLVSAEVDGETLDMGWYSEWSDDWHGAWGRGWKGYHGGRGWGGRGRGPGGGPCWYHPY